MSLEQEQQGLFMVAQVVLRDSYAVQRQRIPIIGSVFEPGDLERRYKGITSLSILACVPEFFSGSGLLLPGQLMRRQQPAQRQPK